MARVVSMAGTCRTSSVQVQESCVSWIGPVAVQVHNYKSNVFNSIAGCCVHTLPSKVIALGMIGAPCLEGRLVIAAVCGGQRGPSVQGATAA